MWFRKLRFETSPSSAFQSVTSFYFIKNKTFHTVDCTIDYFAELASCFAQSHYTQKEY